MIVQLDETGHTKDGHCPRCNGVCIFPLPSFGALQIKPILIARNAVRMTRSPNGASPADPSVLPWDEPQQPSKSDSSEGGAK